MKPQKSYRTGRFVCRIMQLTGWGIVATGGLLMVGGFASGGAIASAIGIGGAAEAGTFLRLLAATPGLLVLSIGLGCILIGQHTSATLDSAENSGEMLRIARDANRRVDTIAGHGDSVMSDPDHRNASWAQGTEKSAGATSARFRTRLPTAQ
ncbi:MAG: hypothetical protein JJU24_12160 [Natronohydrobacter sp.]|nr:hypothetical protein [Natronohydrobacter sp.]